MPDPVQLVLVSCPPDKAQEIASTLVTMRLAACVNVIPRIHSTYRWEGKVQQDDESLLIIKTTTDCFDALKQMVLQLHPYELPEVIAVNLSEGHAPYLDWIAASTQ